VRRGDRLFDIIQTLRAATKPMTARALAERLEVTERTIYRDIATLQARRVPIEGAAGIGYVLRQGFELPPLMFTVDEIEAIVVGAKLTRRLRDPGLEEASRRVLEKIATMLPEALRSGMTDARFHVSEGSHGEPKGIDLSELRRAIRETRKLRISYVDAEGRGSERTIWPLGLAYFVDATLIGAWCELRGDFRYFRVERVTGTSTLDERFAMDAKRIPSSLFDLGSIPEVKRPAAPAGPNQDPHPQ
jgi:predicted DNA-binding transcriptional regulator YafY